jgi:hypothetical protein
MMRVMLLLGLSALTAFASAAATGQDLARLEAARAQWETAQSGDYRFRYQKYCDCDRDEPKITVVTVTNGGVAAVHHLFSDSDREVPAREGSLSDYWTIDDLFDKLVAAYAAEREVRVSYDDDAGFPSSLYIDYLPDAVGDETDLRQIGFEP